MKTKVSIGDSHFLNVPEENEITQQKIHQDFNEEQAEERKMTIKTLIGMASRLKGRVRDRATKKAEEQNRKVILGCLNGFWGLSLHDGTVLMLKYELHHRT